MITTAATQAQHAHILDARKEIPAYLRPSFLRGNILHQQHEDLLTAGLGREGLRRLILAPPFEDFFQPTPDEIRRNAILSSHLGLIDRRKEAGYGTLYGPGIAMNAEGESRISSDGRIPGTEYLAYAADSDGADAVIVLMVQVPDTFDQDNPCIVAATPSGSRASTVA